jgi:addiction module HigA family antidote
MKKLKNIHPGEILESEFLEKLDVSVSTLAKETYISQTRLSQIVSGKRMICADTALRFSKFFGTSVQFWIKLSTDYEIEKSLIDHEQLLNQIKPFSG